MKEIIFTKHVLEESSFRIPKEHQWSEEDIRNYLKILFCSMFNEWIYNYKKVKFFNNKCWTIKMVCYPHKFIYKEYNTNIKIITYIKKTDIDCIEHSLIKQINFYKNMPDYLYDSNKN